MLNDLKELIAIESVMGKPEVGAPFGKGPKEALDWFLSKADSYGLKTGQLDGYCGWAEYGEGAECVAALCHLDVVPAENDWASDPFKLVVDGGKIYGRGVADDKGAVIMCLHALKELKASGFMPKKRLRVIVGLNEENGSECMKYYKKHGEIPAMSFVPDSEFPVINSEKGILHLKARVELDKFFEKNVAHMEGGATINVIPNLASVSIFKDSPLGKRIMQAAGGAITGEIFTKMELAGGILASGANLSQFSVSEDESVITFSATGTAGHAMNPKKGDNAIWKIITLLELLSDGESKICQIMNEYFCSHLGCERLNIFRSDEESGETTMNMGIIGVDDNSLYFTLDLRLPISLKADDAKKAIQAVLPHSKVETLRHSPNLFVAKSSVLVTTLLNVYEEVTGQTGYCIKSGGGTYARELPNSVAFGPTFPGVDANLHKADEFLPVEDFHKAAQIYLNVFKRLSE